MERLRRANAGLEACKGLGRAALITGAGQQRARLAWAAQSPDKLRLELLAVSGHPLAALASDGAHLYLRDNAGDRFYKTRSSRASLEPLVHVPMGVSELIAYLMGRIPLATAERSALMDNPGQPGYILELRRWWGAAVQRIRLDEDGKTVRQVTHFDADGEPTYRVALDGHRVEGNFAFPGRLAVETPTGDRIDIRLERFWPNARIDGGGFQLSP